jgi:hypothetical protein
VEPRLCHHRENPLATDLVPVAEGELSYNTGLTGGLPAFISVLMFELIVLWEDPLLRGMLSDPSWLVRS